MLQLLEVTLRVPKRLVHRAAQLQALNGPERRKLRKKWKQLDAAAAEQQRQQRRQEWQQQQEQERQQQLVVSRRLALLSSVQGAGQMGVLQQQQQQQQQQQLFMQQGGMQFPLPAVDLAGQAADVLVHSGQPSMEQMQQHVAEHVLPQQQQQLAGHQAAQAGAELQQAVVMQEHQQQQLDTLFYQRNCRGRKTRQRTRQEKWLQAQQQSQQDVQGYDDW
jgi:hypothetical protein